VAGCKSTGLPLSTFARRSLVPNILPAAGCAAVLLALKHVIGHSLALLILAALAGCITYLVLYFTTGATLGERQRALAFITRPLPARWRTHFEPPSVPDDKAL